MRKSELFATTEIFISTISFNVTKVNGCVFNKDLIRVMNVNK